MDDVEEFIKKRFRKFCPASTYKSEGRFHFLQGRYKQAIDSFNKALEKNPRYTEAILARALCYSQMFKPEEFVKDINTVVEMDPKSCKVVSLKGKAEFDSGDFESAFLAFHKCLTHRPTFDPFKYSLYKARKAILNSIGKSKLKVTPRDIVAVESLIREPDGRLASKLGKDRLSQTDYKATKILKNVASDKKYLREIISKQMAKEDADNKTISNLALKSLDFLNERQIFWQQLKPFRPGEWRELEMSRPTIIRIRRRKVEEESARQREDAFHLDLPISHKVERLVQNANRELKRSKTQIAEECASRALELMKGVSVDSLPSKPFHKAGALDVIGRVCMARNDLEAASRANELQLHIGINSNLPEVVKRALRRAYRVYLTGEKYTEALSSLADLFRVSETPEEKAFVLHEMSQTFLVTGGLQEARECAAQSLDFARKCENLNIQLRLYILLGLIENCLDHVEEAKVCYEQALSLAGEDSEENDIICSLIDSLDNP